MVLRIPWPVGFQNQKTCTELYLRKLFILNKNDFGPRIATRLTASDAQARSE